MNCLRDFLVIFQSIILSVKFILSNWDITMDIFCSKATIVTANIYVCKFSIFLTYETPKVTTSYINVLY